MDGIELLTEAYEKGYREGKHELAKEIDEVKKDRNYYRDLCTDLYRSVQEMRNTIANLRKELNEMCERCPWYDDEEWDD